MMMHDTAYSAGLLGTWGSIQFTSQYTDRSPTSQLIKTTTLMIPREFGAPYLENFDINSAL